MDHWLRDRYEIRGSPADGGEASVFRAWDHQHDRPVALKIRSVSGTRDRDRIVAEAGVLLSLDAHPGLPLVRENFFVDGKYVIVMDWVEGIDLGRLLAEQGRPGLPLTSVLNYLAQAAEALTHLHGHKPPVIHGDVKPDNLILTSGGKIKLVDFGVALRTDRAPPDRRGTRGFVAPETATGKPASRATATGQALEAFTVTNDTVWALAFTTGDTLAVASADEVVSLWSLAAGRVPRRKRDLGSHRNGALAVAFVDPSTVAATAGDGRVRMWDVGSGAAIAAPLSLSGSPLRHLVAAPNGTMWTASQDGDITRIDALVLGAACAEAGASLDQRQRDRLLAGHRSLVCIA